MGGAWRSWDEFREYVRGTYRISKGFVGGAFLKGTEKYGEDLERSLKMWEGLRRCGAGLKAHD